MKKRVMKIFSLILVGIAALSTVSEAWNPTYTPNYEAYTKPRDPFSEMFDADVELVESLSKLAIRMEHDPRYIKDVESRGSSNQEEEAISCHATN